MMPNITKGGDMPNLLRYLAGPGRHNEHTNPRVVAGDLVTMGVYAGPLTPARAVELARLLDSPRQTLLNGAPVLATNYAQARALIAGGMERGAAFAEATSDQHVWHCSLTLRPEEGSLAEGKWQRVAEDFMVEMGFSGRRDGIGDVRWAAVHHGLNKGGGDHVHIAMSVVRPDGSLVDLYRDYSRAQAAAGVLERRHGLEVLYSREEGGTERATRPGERARAERTGAPETDREALQRRVRALATASGSEAEWVREMRAAGLLVRPYYAKGGIEEVSGYSVGLRPQRGSDGTQEKALTYGGGRLARDLTLTSLRMWAGWDRSEQAHAEALTEWRKGTGTGGRSLIVSPLARREAAEALARWSEHVRAIPVEDRDGWARAASQSSGLFAALSVSVEHRPGPLDRLSRQLARAGDLPAHRRRPEPSPSNGLRAVSRMLWSATSPASSNLALMYAMTGCLLAIREALEASGRAQAAARMASEARRALTEIHMRAEGIDPDRPYDRREGSPAWSVAARVGGFVAGHDPAEIEALIEARRAAGPTRGSSPRTGVGDPRTGSSGPLPRGRDARHERGPDTGR